MPSRVSSQPTTKPFLKNGATARVSRIMTLSPFATHFRIPRQDDEFNPYRSSPGPREPVGFGRKTLPDLDGPTHAAIRQFGSPDRTGWPLHARCRRLLLAWITRGAAGGHRPAGGELVRRQPRRHPRTRSPPRTPAVRLLRGPRPGRVVHSLHLCRADAGRPHEPRDWRWLPHRVLPPDDRDCACDACRRSLPHFILEVRSDRIADPAGAWIAPADALGLRDDGWIDLPAVRRRRCGGHPRAAGHVHRVGGRQYTHALRCRTVAGANR